MAKQEKSLYMTVLMTPDMANFSGHVNFVGKSSMEVGIRVEAENIINKQVRHTNSCYFTMVARGSDNSPVEVPPLQLESENEKHLFEAAKLRRALRKEVEEKHAQFRLSNQPKG